jgi:hypothetical protein
MDRTDGTEQKLIEDLWWDPSAAQPSLVLADYLRACAFCMSIAWEYKRDGFKRFCPIAKSAPDRFELFA